MMTWFLVEALGTTHEPMTIVSKDGQKRDWTGIRRFDRDEGVDLLEPLNWVRRSGTTVTQTITGGMGPRHVEAYPILSVENEVYGIHVWIGREDEPVPPPRPGAAISWRLDDLIVQQRIESWMMSTDDEDGFKRTRSPGEFFRKVVRFDDVTKLIEIATKPSEGQRFETGITVLHDRGHLMSWLVVGRTSNTDAHIGMRALTYDVTDVAPPQIGPLETLGLTSEPSPDAPAAALLAFPPDSERAIIAQWIGKVPAYIDWRRDGDSELIDPDSQRKLARTTAILEPGLPDSEIVTEARIRAHNAEGWQPVTITARRYPGEVGGRLHIIRIAKSDV
ncbi:GAF domain-containing protein [Nocardia asteroides]